MAIGNRQIGWSEEENLLWEISRQLDRMNSILCPCPITTTTTSSSSTTTTTTTVYNCYSYTLNNLGVVDYATWIGCDGTPQGSVVTDLTYNLCAQLDTVVYAGEIVYNGDCSITTTTTTTIPLVFTTDLFQDCGQPCGTACDPRLPVFYNVFMTQECIDSFPTIGCEIWEDDQRTKPFPDGTYNVGNGDCIVITGGIITNIIPK